MTVVIRAPEVTELAALMRLVRAKAAFDGAAELLKIDEAGLRDALFVPQPKMRALVAVVDGELVAIATYYDIYSSLLGKPGLWLDDLYVDETQRSRGIGKLLIANLCAEANRNGCARIDWLVASNNARGQEFYKSLGADVSQHVRHVRLDVAAISSLATA